MALGNDQKREAAKSALKELISVMASLNMDTAKGMKGKAAEAESPAEDAAEGGEEACPDCGETPCTCEG